LKEEKYREIFKQTDVVILSSIEWNWQWSRHHRISFWFSKYFRNVYFVENIPKRVPSVREAGRVLERMGNSSRKNNVMRRYDHLLESSGNIKIITPFSLPSNNILFNSLNRHIWMKKLYNRLTVEFRVKNPFIWCYLPVQSFLDLIGLLDPEILAYDCVTNFIDDCQSPADIEATEKKLLEIADIVTCDSDYLYKQKGKYRKDILQILPGVKYELFNKADSGPFKGEVKKVCYFGGVNNARIDTKIIEEIALAGFKVLIIGPVRNRIQELPREVSFTGMVEHEKIPGLLKDCDCIILPYRLGRFSEGIIPAKFFECFAAGKPIISTGIKNFLKYKDLIIIRDDGSGFVDALRNMEKHENMEKYRKRLQIAREYSEKNRFDSLLEKMYKKLEHKR